MMLILDDSPGFDDYTPIKFGKVLEKLGGTRYFRDRLLQKHYSSNNK